jgi:adenylyltransferase/sulfurtransferase
MPVNRYHRQILLPQITQQGQNTLVAARVLLVGCGALGTHVAEQLVRSGIGLLRIADRDIVELTNLQRQVLFDENDAQRHWPKALAAAERLQRINSDVKIDPHIVDVHNHNVEALTLIKNHPVDLILDGTDNVATRYLLNDVAVKLNIPWIYSACVGTEGRVMAIQPGITPCLRCIFSEPPNASTLPTCDSAGVLTAAAAIAASLQCVAAIQSLLEKRPAPKLISFDAWTTRFHEMDLSEARNPDCPCCATHQFDFLNAPSSATSSTLCGRDAVQIRGDHPLQLQQLAGKWRTHGQVEENRFFVRCHLESPPQTVLTAFQDGRLIIQGTRDIARAKSLYAQFIGS